MVECLLEVFAGILRVAAFEKEIAHRDQTLHVSGLDPQAFSEVLGRALEILLLQTNDTHLTVRLEMGFVIFNNIIIVNHGLFRLFLSLMENFGETKMSRHTFRIEFEAMFEVLLGLDVVGLVSQLSSKMDCRTKMLLILRQTLLKLIDRLLVHLFLLVLTAELEIGYIIWLRNF